MSRAAVPERDGHVSGHVWRPLLVVIALVAVLLVVRQIYVPDDFGVHQNGYSYGWYRQASIGDWKWLPVKYQGKESCVPCHQKQVHARDGTPHVAIQCENCHGPGTDHPKDPAKLPIDRTRALCLRCHVKLQYPSSARGGLRGIDPSIAPPRSAVRRLPSATPADADGTADPEAPPAPQQRVLQALPPGPGRRVHGHAARDRLLRELPWLRGKPPDRPGEADDRRRPARSASGATRTSGATTSAVRASRATTHTRRACSSCASNPDLARSPG